MSLALVAFTILLCASILFVFYLLNIAKIVKSTYNVDYSVDLNERATEALGILEQQSGGVNVMDLLGRGLSLNSNMLEYTVDDTLEKVYDDPYRMMLDFDVGFLAGYGDAVGASCEVSPPASFFDNGAPRFLLKWPGKTKPTEPHFVTSLYGPRYIYEKCSCHQGMDFRFTEGSDVYATYPGLVEFAGTDETGVYGILIRIKHWIGVDKKENIGDATRPDFYTYYGHLKQAFAKVGQWVNAGEHIADSGNTGKSTGAHLHLELRNSQKNALNPCTFLEYKPMECTLFESRSMSCGSSKKAPLTFDVAVPGAIKSGEHYLTKATGVLYK
jgi:murein DD-endopeptidase MepM/ murein hydrolase activator NlpD